MMKQIKSYADDRLYDGKCIYCGAKSETREHVPPKIFLDRPFPENLYVVKACAECNASFSLDEEYMACLLECAICGTTNPNGLRRASIKKTLDTQDTLAKRLQSAQQNQGNETIFSVEYDRITNVVQKIAIGHILYELDFLVSESPKVIAAPLPILSDHQIAEFESLGSPDLAGWPEVGSRAMQRLVEYDENYYNGWVIVQPGRYRYAVMQEGMEVRMVFSEYLMCWATWEDDV